MKSCSIFSQLFQLFPRLEFEQAARFSTWLKDRAAFEVIERRPVDPEGDVFSDSILYFLWLVEEKDECFFRVVELYDRGQRRVLRFLMESTTGLSNLR